MNFKQESFKPENTIMRPNKSSRAQEQGDVLVVDDTLANLRLLINLLSSQGYNVRPAQSGALALAAVAASKPDIILLDINMPNMDGFELCQELKSMEATRDIPIIFISALNDTDSKLKAFTSGGVDYVCKPFQLEEVSARIKTHLTMKRLQVGLEQRNRDLAAFDRSVAHDLRSPLTAMLGISELMTIAPDQRTDENVATLVDAGNRMRSIIDSLLLFAKVGNDEAEIVPFDMGALVIKVVASLKHDISSRGAEITVDGEDWPTVLGHEPWVERVWTNYITNGLKYGGLPPKITLGWSLEPGASAPRFWVQDNGHGLTQEQSKMVFCEFKRLEGAESEEGHGLGLSIVRRIVERLGGEVGLESVVGRGSRFYFTLRTADAAQSGDRLGENQSIGLSA